MNQNSYYPNQGTAPPYQNFVNQSTSTNQNNQTEPLYAENLLELNVGKRVRVYMSYTDSLEWRDKIFTGIIEAAGRDYVLLYDQETGNRFALWTVYLNYVEFFEPVNINESRRRL